MFVLKSKKAKEKILVRSGTSFIPITCLAEKSLSVLQHNLRASLGRLWDGKKLPSTNWAGLPSNPHTCPTHGILLLSFFLSSFHSSFILPSLYSLLPPSPSLCFPPPSPHSPFLLSLSLSFSRIICGIVECVFRQVHQGRLRIRPRHESYGHHKCLSFYKP